MFLRVRKSFLTGFFNIVRHTARDESLDGSIEVKHSSDCNCMGLLFTFVLTQKLLLDIV